VRERLELGVDHTIVALAGGTGSGKSSVFNALSGLEFADVGVRRPTTAEVTACVWAHHADGLLDWLGVSRERRIERESALDGDTQADLRGLVLLDLPDHDSIEPEHREVVDRVLPQVDVLVWVVDPQKYADDALHTRYLRRLTGHEGAMLVLLNQIDTVPVDAQASLLRDVDRLLREDGLTDVGVFAASAATGDGLPGVRGVLARAVASRGVAELRVQAELDDASRALAGAVAPAEPDVAAAATRAVDGLLAAAAVPVSVAAVEAAVRRGGGTVRLGPVQPDRAAAVRREWLETIEGGLPTPWRAAVADTVPDTAAFAALADERLAAVVVTTRPTRADRMLRAVAGVAGVLTLGFGGFAAGSLVGEGTWTWDDQSLVLGATTGGLALLALALLGLARGIRRRSARRRAEAVGVHARRGLAAAVDAALVRPSTQVLEDHRRIRDVVTAVAPPTALSSLVEPSPVGETPAPRESSTPAEPSGQVESSTPAEPSTRAEPSTPADADGTSPA
jgi:GTP-binding protein EngB required for normal cell division